MRNSSVLEHVIAVGGLGLLLVTSCSKETGSPDPQSALQEEERTNHAKKMPGLKNVIGMELPSNAIVLDEGGGRNDDIYHEWVIHSPSEISTMPMMDYGGKKDYLMKDAEQVKELIESRVSKVRNANASSAFTSVRRTAEYEYRGSILRTDEGDYLIVKRFKHR